MYCDLLRVELRNDDYLIGRGDVGCCYILVQK